MNSRLREIERLHLGLLVGVACVAYLSVTRPDVGREPGAAQELARG